MVSVGDNDNIQIGIPIYSSQKAQTYMKSAPMKWDRKTVLGVYVLNLRMMSVGDNDNIQIDRHIYSSQKSQTYIKSAQIKWDIKAKC